MAGVKVVITEEGITEAIRRLRKLAESDLPAVLEPAFRDIGEHLKNATDARFESESGPDGAAWAPLSESWLKRKTGPRIGHEDGRMKETTYQTIGTELHFGSQAAEGKEDEKGYAAAFQWGYEPRNQPARPFLGINADDEEAIVYILNQHIQLVIEGRA